MRQIEIIKQKYDRALERYKVLHPTLNEINNSRQFTLCGLCGGSVLTTEIKEHMLTHEIAPPANLVYQLTLPFHKVNGKIANGIQFVKLLVLYSGDSAISVPYNGLSLQDWQKLTDVNDVKIRFSAKKRRFVRTLWIVIILCLTQIN